jgi:3'-phosphoadenosine 5'-phosphosulfate sulfotransferase (PAPS reductase)/FAD synthetase
MGEFDYLWDGPANPRFVIFCSYGNDSVAMIQWAHEQELEGVHVVYTDTGWAAEFWKERVNKLEEWVRQIGFHPHRTSSVGFRQLAFDKKAFPTQRYQWCSYLLKIAPGERWLATNDPEARAVCLVGVRRDESQDRAEFPRFMLRSNSHGNRVMVAPMADWDMETRDVFIRRAGVEPLPHRSMECSPCVNSNKRDLVALSEDDAAKAEALENDLNDELGLTRNGKRRTLFRPHRHMGAVGVREVIRWAHSKRGLFAPEDHSDGLEKWDDEDLGSSGCEAGWCGV